MRSKCVPAGQGAAGGRGVLCCLSPLLLVVAPPPVSTKQAPPGCVGVRSKCVPAGQTGGAGGWIGGILTGDCGRGGAAQERPSHCVPGGQAQLPSSVGTMPLKQLIVREWNDCVHAGAFWTFWANLLESLPPIDFPLASKPRYQHTQCVS